MKKLEDKIVVDIAVSRNFRNAAWRFGLKWDTDISELLRALEVGSYYGGLMVRPL
jgi:hypothetical protein